MKYITPIIMNQMFVSPHNSYVDVLTLVLGVGAFGRLLGQKDEAHTNEINVFIKEISESYFFPFAI